MITPDAVWWTGNSGREPLLGVPVRVLEMRSSYGRHEALIAPIGEGAVGRTWVALASLEQWGVESDDFRAPGSPGKVKKISKASPY